MRKLYKAFFLFSLFLIVIEGRGQLIANGWFNTHDFVENNSAPQYVTRCVEFLADDSNAIWVDGAGKIRQFETYGVGHIFDLLFENWAAVPSNPSYPVAPLPMGCKFIWDSLRFNYFYYRDSLDTQTVDTLIITTYVNTYKNEKQINTDFFTVTDSGYCKMAFPNTYNYYTQSGGKYYKKDTILLRAKDITAIKQRKSISIPIQTWVGDGIRSLNLASRTFNELFGYSVVFKSGTTYSWGDTVFSFEKNKTIKGNLFGVYTSSINKKGARQLFAHNYTENSIWLSKNNRYGGYEKGFFGFVPGMLHPQVKYFDCEVFVNAYCVVSVPEINRVTNAQITALYPNPVAKNEVLTLTLHSKEAANYTVSIKNMLGQTIYSSTTFCDNNIEANKVIILPSLVAQGVYYVVLTETVTNIIADVKKIVLTE